MISPAPNTPEKLLFAEWSTSKAVFPIPTAVIPCGSFDHVDELHRAIAYRLKYPLDYDVDDNDGEKKPIPIGENLMHWLSLRDFDQPLKPDQLGKELAPLLSLSYWQKLVDHKLCERLPDGSSNLMKIQILVICDLQNLASKDSQSVAADWLASLAGDLKSGVMGSQVDWMLSLLVLGKPKMEVGKIQAYWPRFYLGTQSIAGADVKVERIEQVCQNVVVSLISSEFAQLIMTSADLKKDSVKWIALGASAILTDLQAIRHRYIPEVHGQFTRPLVPNQLSVEQKQILDSVAEQKRKRHGNNLLCAAQTIVSQRKWNISPSCRIKSDFGQLDLTVEPEVIRDKSKRYGCYLDYASELSRRVFGSSAESIQWWLDESRDEFRPNLIDPWYKRVWAWSKFQWAHLVDLSRSVPIPNVLELEKLLPQNYQVLAKALNVDMREPAKQEYDHLLNTLAFLVERRGYKESELPLEPKREWPSGLKAAEYLAGRLEETLSRSAVLFYCDSPVPIAKGFDDEYCLASASADVDQVKEAINRYQRTQHSIQSPLTVLLNSIVAWPLLAGLIGAFVNWSYDQIAAASLFLLFVISCAEWIYWRFKDRQALVAVRAEINECFAKRVLSFVAGAIQLARLENASRLPLIKNLLGELAAEFEKEDKAVVEEKQKYSFSTSEEDEVLYRLVAYEQILGKRTVLVDQNFDWDALRGEDAFVWDEPESGKVMLSWKSEAKRIANADAAQDSAGMIDRAETAFVIKAIMPILKETKMARTVVNSLKSLSLRFADMEFKPNLLAAYSLADKNPDLESGRKWKWLYERAIPLGGAEDKQASFTAVLVNDQAPLSQATGEQSEYWIKDTKVVLSRMPNEIGCIRGVVDWV